MFCISTNTPMRCSLWTGFLTIISASAIKFINVSHERFINQTHFSLHMHLYLEYEQGWKRPYLAFLIDFRARESGSMCCIGTAEETYEKLVQAIAPLLVRCPEPIQRHYQSIQPELLAETEQIFQLRAVPAIQEKPAEPDTRQDSLTKIIRQFSLQPGHA